MAVWDNTMPLDFSDGTVVNELHLDPIVRNLATLQYAAVFLGGQQRSTDATPTGGTETMVLQTPVVSMDAGYLYKIEGALAYSTDTVGSRCSVNIRQTNLAGATIGSYSTLNTDSAGATNYFPFLIYVKATSSGTQSYVVGTRTQNGGLVTARIRSWISISRSGDSSLLTEV